jgi:hypothetical protein
VIPNAHLKTADETLPITLFDSPKLAQQKLIQKLSEVMDERYKKFLLYGALEGKTLVFYFSHNAIASEFIGKIEDFRENIIPLYKEFNMKSTLFFKNIQAKTKHKPIERKVEKEPYRDTALGTFDINVKDAAIAKVFKKLRETIRRTHDN